MERLPVQVDVILGDNDEDLFGVARIARDGSTLLVTALHSRWRLGPLRLAVLAAGALLAVVAVAASDTSEGEWLLPLAVVGLLVCLGAWVVGQPRAAKWTMRYDIGLVRLAETDSLDLDARGFPVGGNPFRLAFEAQDGRGGVDRYVLQSSDAKTTAALLSLLTP